MQLFDFTQKAHTLWSWGLAGLAVHQGENQASSCLSELSNCFSPRVLVSSEGERVNCVDLSVWKLPAAIHPPTQPHCVQCNGRGSNKQDNRPAADREQTGRNTSAQSRLSLQPWPPCCVAPATAPFPPSPTPVLLPRRLQPAPGPLHILCAQSSVLLLWLPRADPHHYLPTPHLPTRFLTDCSQYCAEVTMNFIGMMSSGPVDWFSVSLPILAVYLDVLSGRVS